MYRVLNEGEWVTKNSTTEFVLLSDLEPGTTYEVMVVTECKHSFVESTLITFTTICPSVFSVTPGLITATSATVSWVVEFSVSQFEIVYKMKGSSTHTNITTTAQSQSLTNLQPATDYEVNISSICRDVASIPAIITLRTLEENETMRLFPNPTEGIIQIHHSKNLKGRLYTISDLTGKKVYQNLLEQNSLSVATLNIGTYILFIEGEKPLKFIKLK